ncbi:hypothetical protein [secondary endosymbiont of Heteropsylla cubana]|uniref:hypothetical protein n=1 Tax=secondary endosymbiont of Heteropsylla cubana TaxID=134287 RepID=UPI00135C6D50|nr:hypothetical protein [secondary endosymbiont of Heteropsylla cubana]
MFSYQLNILSLVPRLLAHRAGNQHYYSTHSSDWCYAFIFTISKKIPAMQLVLLLLLIA